jgi:SAM-dependent methyltransferase
MNEILRKSWSSITKKSAKNYLKGFGNGSLASKVIVAEILKDLKSKLGDLKVIEFGCGNGQLFETLVDNGVNCHYTGVDFSEPLLSVARENFINYDAKFVNDDVEKLSNITEKYNVGIYSHVIEVLSSPEESLFNAKQITDIIIIRFFEPPKFDYDRVELRQMKISEESEETVPYIRRQMSRDYYRLMLTKIGCAKVEVYEDLTSNDEVHVLYFEDSK